jgi:hypothetical protein
VQINHPSIHSATGNQKLQRTISSKNVYTIGRCNMHPLEPRANMEISLNAEVALSGKNTSKKLESIAKTKPTESLH